MAAGAAELVGDGTHQQAPQPGIESSDIAERRQVAPAPHERLLDCVFGSIRVAKDETSDRVEPVDDRCREEIKSLSLAGSRPRNERSLIAAHRSASYRQSLPVPFTLYWRGNVRKRSNGQPLRPRASTGQSPMTSLPRTAT